jgi:hypothetical protein
LQEHAGVSAVAYLECANHSSMTFSKLIDTFFFIKLYTKGADYLHHKTVGTLRALKAKGTKEGM